MGGEGAWPQRDVDVLEWELEIEESVPPRFLTHQCQDFF
jgi:hypothetical protein